MAMKNSIRIFLKEVREFLRTYKIYTVPGILLLFGFASPILTKIMPDLLGNLAGDMGITLPEMSWIDSYDQFFKNVVQIGMLAIILTTMGSIADERNRGVAQLVLTKPVSRTGYIVAKYFANFLLVSVAALLAFLATWFYTDILFEGTEFVSGLAGTGLYILYVGVILALTILGSSISKSSIAAGGIAVLGYFVIGLLPLFSTGLSKYSPGALSGYINAIIRGTANLTDVWWAVAVAIATIIALLSIASLIFKHQEL